VCRPTPFLLEPRTRTSGPATPRLLLLEPHPGWSSHFSNPRSEPPLKTSSHALVRNARAAGLHLRKRNIDARLHVAAQPLPRQLYDFVRATSAIHCVSRRSSSSAFQPFSECQLHRRYKTIVHLLKLIAGPGAALPVEIKDFLRNEKHAQKDDAPTHCPSTNIAAILELADPGAASHD